MRVPSVNRQQTAPLDWQNTRRSFPIEIGTSLPVGKVVPVAAIDLLRHDNFKANVQFNLEMLETNELLANRVNARISAYVVPNLAMARFERSRDQFDRSYMGQPQIEGGDVVPFYDYEAMGAVGVDDIYQYMGLHAKEGDNVETGYAEAYNLIHNFRLRNRSRELFETTERSRTDKSLAQAFWDVGRFRDILPSFDQSVMEGEVPLTIIDGDLPVTGLGIQGTGYWDTRTRKVTGADDVTGKWFVNPAAYNQEHNVSVAEDPNNPGYPAVYAALQSGSLSFSLAQIEQVRKLQKFAKLREQFTGLADDEADEYIIDLLMSGIRIPDQHLMQPILVAQKTVQFSQGLRHATDSGNLDDSAVSGFASANMTIRVPQIDTGGIVMIVVETFPQQLFERQADPRFNNYSQVQAVLAEGNPQTFYLPEPMRDHNDPEKVDVVRNDQVDVIHGTPAATFGYAPLNWQWTSMGPRLGGKFYQGVAGPADRQRFWAAETENPVLGEDFFLVPADLQTDIFLRTGDPFECFAGGSAEIVGRTQFGAKLVEQTTNYEKLEAQMDNERIDQEA